MQGEWNAWVEGPEPESALSGTRSPAAGSRLPHRHGLGWTLAGGVLLAAAIMGAGLSGLPAGKAAPSAASSAPRDGAPSLSLAPPAARRPTFVLFQTGTSTLARQFLVSLRRDG